MASNFIAGDRDIVNPTLVDLHKQLAKRDVPDRGSLPTLLEHEKRHGG
jgi:hypothetical protein